MVASIILGVYTVKSMFDSAVAWPTITPMKEVETVAAQQMQKASNRAPSLPLIVLESASTETKVPDNAGAFDGIQTNTVAVAYNGPRNEELITEQTPQSSVGSGADTWRKVLAECLRCVEILADYEAAGSAPLTNDKARDFVVKSPEFAFRMALDTLCTECRQAVSFYEKYIAARPLEWEEIRKWMTTEQYLDVLRYVTTLTTPFRPTTNAKNEAILRHERIGQYADMVDPAATKSTMPKVLSAP